MDRGPACACWIWRTVNRRASRLQLASILVIGAVLSACADGPDAPDAPGGHIEFTFENDTRQLCAGSESHLNHYVERAFGFFAEPVPGDFLVPVRVVDAAPCAGKHGCYHGQTVYVDSLDLGERVASGLRHELSHAVIGRVWGNSVPFFAEGLAESLSRSFSWSSVSAEVAPVGDVLDIEAKDLDYTVAARFVRFLIDTRGLARFKQLFQAASIRTQDAIRANFVDVYGEDFEALEAEYLSGAPRCTFQVDICDEARAERVRSGWSLSFAASCDDPDFYGSIGDADEAIATQRTIFVESAGSYHLSTSSPVLLARCGGCEEQGLPNLVYREADLELAVGLYTLEFTLTEDAVVTLELGSEAANPGPP